MRIEAYLQHRPEISQRKSDANLKKKDDASKQTNPTSSEDIHIFCVCFFPFRLLYISRYSQGEWNLYTKYIQNGCLKKAKTMQNTLWGREAALK